MTKIYRIDHMVAPDVAGTSPGLWQHKEVVSSAYGTLWLVFLICQVSEPLTEMKYRYACTISYITEIIKNHEFQWILMIFSHFE